MRGIHVIIPDMLNINVNVHEDGVSEGTSVKLDRLIRLVETILKKEIHMSKELDALTLEVAETTEVQASAITLLQGLSARIAELKADPAALQKLADELNASATSLATAVTENTPAEDLPVEEPV